MSEDNLKVCLQTLRSAQSDNERFAALLLVTKVVQAENTDVETRREILDALGFKFLTRLIKSKSVPEGCPPGIFKLIGLNILSSFIHDPEVVSNPEMKKQVTVFNEIILGQFNEEEEEEEEEDDDISDKRMLSDCYDCIQGMVVSPVGRQYLIDGSAVAALVEVIVTNRKSSDRALTVLQDLQRLEGSTVWEKREGDMHKLLSYLVKDFQQTKDATKYEQGEVIASFLSYFESEIEDSQSWLTELVQELNGIFRSKLGSTLRDSALTLASALISSQGVACLLPPMTEDCKLLLLVTHMSCIEVRMVLEDGRVEQIRAKAGVLCACYGLLENVIGYMTTGTTLMLDKKQIVQLHSAMLGAFNSIIFFLSQVSQDAVDIPTSHLLVTASIRVLGAWLAEETSALKDEVYNLLPFLIQICKDNFRDMCGSNMETDPLPGLEGLSMDDQTDGQACASNQKDDSSDLLVEGCIAKELKTKCVRFDETADKGSADKMHGDGENGGDSASVQDSSEMNSANVPDDSDAETSANLSQSRIDLIQFLLPGFCHLTSEDKARTSLLGEGIHVLLVDYFKRQTSYFLEHRDELDIKDSLASVCGVFLNLIITETDLVTSHHKFHQLLALLCTFIKLTVHDGDVLVLTGNFVILGLMLLRHQKDRTDISSEDRDQFLAGSISFLSKAHTKGGNPVRLEVSESYEPFWHDIVELWLLSMQGLGELVPACPELSQLLMRSGWIPALIRMLLEVKGSADTDTVAAFMSLLTTLVTHSKSARKVIMEKRGLELSQMYHSKDLEARLTGS